METTTKTPATETAPVIPAAPPAEENKGPLTPEQVDAVVGNLLKPKVSNLPEIQKQKPAAKQDKPKEPEAKFESDADKNFAALRKKAEEAEKRASEREAELTKVREEYDTFKKNPVPKEYEEKLTAAEKRAQELQANLRIADLARDPEFQGKYNKPIEASVRVMSNLFVEVGADAAEIKTAIATWNEEQFSDWADMLPAAKRLRFNAAYQKAIELDMQRNQELADSETTWTNIQKQRQTEAENNQKQYLASLKSERNSVFAEIEATHKELLADPDIRRQTEEMLDRAIGADGKGLSTRDMLSSLAHTHTLAHHFKRVEGERAKLVEENAALKAKLEERDTFIKGVNGSIPVPSGSAPSQSAADVDSIVGKLLRPSVRV